MTVLLPGINGPILAALQTIFVAELQTNLTAAGDPLAFLVIKQADLQDDPTQVAPFLVYRDDHNKGRTRVPKDLEHMYGAPEIGGPAKYLHYFEGNFGSPHAATRDQCRDDLDTIASRIQATLEYHYDLSWIGGNVGMLTSPDGSTRLEGANELLIDEVKTTIFGGETDFWGRGSLFWHYPVYSYTLLRGGPPR